ncbi:restriction endonuclease EcoRII, partial [Elysia marginata]
MDRDPPGHSLMPLCGRDILAQALAENWPKADFAKALEALNWRKASYLSQYFQGVAAKKLSAVEADTLVSNQHEFNGVEGLRDMLGEPVGKHGYEAQFLYLTDSDEFPIVESGFLTWYDARQRARIERGVMRYEYRLYFPTNTASQLANEGDTLIIAKKPDNTLLAIIAEAETTISRQLLWLFGFTNDLHPSFSVRQELETEQDQIAFASRFVLESIGIDVETSAETFLDAMLQKFGKAFPKTSVFSAYARSTLPDINPQDDYDAALMVWMEREEILFRTMEKHIIGERLAQGFGGDVDDFIAFSLSVQNRRKSRAGLALENHLEALFSECSISYSRGAMTEHKSKPDFIFPSIEHYHDNDFEPNNLTMLGVKSSCKDRWRQVLTEANKI